MKMSKEEAQVIAKKMIMDGKKKYGGLTLKKNKRAASNK